MREVFQLEPRRMAAVMALSQARKLVRDLPDSNALVITVELPTLTFQRCDL